MYRRIYIYIMMLMAFGLSLTGCRGAEEPAVSDETEQPANVVYMRLVLNLNSSPATRSDDTGSSGSISSSGSNGPTAGEMGDGWEYAEERENHIRDLNIFFYRCTEPDAINSDYANEITVNKQVYIPDISGKGYEYTGYTNDNPNLSTDSITAIYKLIPIEDYVPNANDWVIVVANCGEEIKGIKTLADFRTMIFTSCWGTGNDSKPTYFTMATARTVGKRWSTDGKVFVESSTGTKIDPFMVTTTIERTAARIDFWYDKTKVKGEGEGRYIEYEAQSDKERSATVRITDIRPVNLRDISASGSYYLKHVTRSLNDKTLKYCDEETVRGRFPDNYVIDPTTKDANKAFEEDSRAEGILDVFKNNPTQAATVFQDYSVAHMLDYLEKVDHSESGWSSSFNRYSILCYANENTHLGTGYFSSYYSRKYLTGLLFKALYIPAEVYAAVDAEGKLTKDDNWEEGMTFWRFTPSVDSEKSVYFSSETAATDYRKAKPELNGIITKYENGVCYYNLWLKHANYDSTTAQDPQELFEMQYGIVRNNIYRIGVSFTGPGDPEPKMNGPINMRPKIYVRKWNQRVEEQIIF